MEKYLADFDYARWQFPKKKAENSFIGDYTPEMDWIPSLEHDLASWYQSLIGILRWMVEIGRVEIITEVSVMVSYMDMPREGKLEAVLHVLAFLRQKYDSRMEFDPTYPVIDMNGFKDYKLKDFYGGFKDAITPNSPE